MLTPNFLIVKKAGGEATTVGMTLVLTVFGEDSWQKRELFALVEKYSNFKLLPGQKIIDTDDMHL